MEDVIDLFFALEALEDQEKGEIQRRRRRRRIWTQEWYKNRSVYSHTRIIEEFQRSPYHFKTYMRISRENYDKILKLIAPVLSKKIHI